MSLTCILLLVVSAGARELLLLGWLERSLLYFPSQEIGHPLSAFGADAEEVWFGEHARLHGVYVPGPAGPDSRQLTLVFFHGNGGNVTHRAPFVARLNSELGVSILIFDYQGYGKSSGRPSEQATAADAQAAVEYFETRADARTDRMVYYGESLGGAVAIRQATIRPPLGLVLQSSFTSLAAMTRQHYPYLAPLLPYVTTSYDSRSAISSVTAPLLLIHGDADSVVPAEQSIQLQAAAGGPARLLLIPAAGHNDVFARGGRPLWQALREFLDALS